MVVKAYTNGVSSRKIKHLAEFGIIGKIFYLLKQSVKSDGVINLFSGVGEKVFQMPPHNPEVQAYP